MGNVYTKYAELPEFDQLNWCLQEGNAGFVFMHCAGLDFSLIFDAQSFLNSAESVGGNYKLLKKISEEQAAPSMFQDMLTVGDSLTMVSKNTTRTDVAQEQTIMTFYRVGDADNMQVKARKNGFQGSHEVLSAWGSEKYQLYHLHEIATGGEEIRVYYYRSEYAAARVVTELDLTQLAEVPSKTNLFYDVYKTGSTDDDYSIYVAARYEPFSGGLVKYYLYRHDIESSGNGRGFVKAQVALGAGDAICVDQVRVFDKLVVLACKERG